MNQQNWRMRLLVAVAFTATLSACGGGGAASDGASETTAASATTEPAATEEATAEATEEATAEATEDAAAEGDAVAVTGVEYEFQGLSDTLPAGTELTFTNGGEEAHELVLVRIKDGETRPLEELIQLPPKQAEKVTEFQGVAIAGPGEDGQVVEGELTLAEAGRYAAVCFIPVGTTELPDGPPAEGEEPAGPPHVAKGMVAEITVE